MNSNTSTLLKIVEQFTLTILGSDQPNNLCFTLSLPLLYYLEIKGAKCKLSSGSYGDYRHFWLTLIDSPDTIIDVTRIQFDDYDGSIYIGPLDKKFYSPDNAEFKDVLFYGFKSWSEPLLGIHRSNPLTVEDELRLNSYNVKCAAFLYETMAFHHLKLNFEEKKSLSNRYFIIIRHHLTLKKAKDPKYIQSFIDNQTLGFERMAIDFGIIRLVDGHYLY